MRTALVLLAWSLLWATSQARSETPLRALFLSMEAVQTAPDADRLLDRCRQMGLNAVLVAPYFYGRNVTYASERFPQVQFRGDEAVFGEGGALVDQLALLLDRARPRGVQVHVSYDVGTGRPDMEGAALQQHPDWQVQDWRGARHPWMDFGNPEVRAYTLQLLTDVVGSHRVDGLNLDYIRYARSHWCCCDRCRAGFAGQSGYDPVGLIPLPVTGEVNSSPAISPTTATVLARFEDGTPALATNALGAGKVLLINYEPFGAAEATADAAAQSALRAFGLRLDQPVHLLTTAENEAATPGSGRAAEAWMTRLEVRTAPLQPEQLGALPPASCALVYCLQHCSEEHARQLEAFVRAGGGLIWAVPTGRALANPAVQRVLDFAEMGRWSNRVRTIEATEAQSWLPGTGVPVDKRVELIAAWRRYRAAGLTALVADISREARRLNPEVQVSAFVMPDQATANDALQDWAAWLQAGLIDYALPMSYSGEKKLASDLDQWRAIDPTMRRIIPALAFFDKSLGEQGLPPDAVLRQAAMCRAAGAGGVAWFSLDQLTPQIEAALAVQH